MHPAGEPPSVATDWRAVLGYSALHGRLDALPVQGGRRIARFPRTRWAEAGIAYVRRAGLMYSWELRHFILVAPILAYLLHPIAGPIAAVLVVAVLGRFDRISSGTPKDN